MTTPHPLAPLAHLDGVAEAVAAAREACEELRWHRGLRRGWAVARTEAGVRAARAGLAFDGVRVPLTLVRDIARGATEPPAGPERERLLGALRVQAEVERLMTPPGTPSRGRGHPAGQLLARLHAAAAGAVPDAGRPRGAGAAGGASRTGADGGASQARADGVPGVGDDDVPPGAPTDDGSPHGPPEHGELRGLGPAPVGGELRARLAMLQGLLDRPTDGVPAVVLGAVVLGEMLALRPFEAHNAAVGRALLRHVLTSSGVDPVGVVVTEAAWVDVPLPHLATAAQYATGQPEGVGAWLRYVAGAVVLGAQEGTAVADAVLAGRLGGPDTATTASRRDAVADSTGRR